MHNYIMCPLCSNCIMYIPRTWSKYPMLINIPRDWTNAIEWYWFRHYQSFYARLMDPTNLSIESCFDSNYCNKIFVVLIVRHKMHYKSFSSTIEFCVRTIEKLNPFPTTINCNLFLWCLYAIKLLYTHNGCMV